MSLNFLFLSLSSFTDFPWRQHDVEKNRGAWVAQSVKRPTSAQVMISQFVSSSPALGSVLTAQSLEPALDSISPSLPAPLPFKLCLSVSVSVSVSLSLKNK